MPRVPYVNDDSDIGDRIRQRRGGTLTPLDRVLLHSPAVAHGWNELLGAIRQRTDLPGDIRELVICRVAVLNGADYEWAAHAPIAEAEGATAEQLAAVRSGDLAVLTDRQRVAIEYATAMTEDVLVPAETYATARQHFDDRQLVELTATIGAYNLVSRFLVAMQIEPADRVTVG